MITILMPIFNGIEFIEESISSIINQTFQKWELIVGINGHPVGSNVYQIAKQYELKSDKIKVLDFYTFTDKSSTLNEMLKYSKYEWICLLDVDDIWLPNKLKSQLPHINQYDVIGTRCKYFGDKHISPPIPTGDITKFDFIKVNPIINSSCLVKKNLCRWNEKCRVEDYDMWLRLWKDKRRFYNVDSIQVLHRIHQDSAFNSKGNHLVAKEIIKNY